MLAVAPPAPRHAYVEGVHIRTGSDGRIYRLCRVCDDRANASPHRGYRQKPLTARERADRHRFDPSLTVFLRDSRGHKTPACLVCGKAKRATEHGGITAPLPPVDDAEYVTPADRRPKLRALPHPRPAKNQVDTRDATTPKVRVAKTVDRMPAEIVQAALSIDRLLALPDDLVDWRLRMRLLSARELMGIPVFPTLDSRLADSGTATESAGPDAAVPDPAPQPGPVTPRPVPAAPAVATRGILAGIRNDRIRELVKRAAAADWTVGKTGGGHISIAKGRNRIIVSGTSGDARMGHSWGNVRAAAKRAGLDVSGL